jgi:hypothetical protein
MRNTFTKLFCQTKGISIEKMFCEDVQQYEGNIISFTFQTFYDPCDKIIQFNCGRHLHIQKYLEILNSFDHYF